jgi:hypothetical protein
MLYTRTATPLSPFSAGCAHAGRRAGAAAAAGRRGWDARRGGARGDGRRAGRARGRGAHEGGEGGGGAVAALLSYFIRREVYLLERSLYHRRGCTALCIRASLQRAGPCVAKHEIQSIFPAQNGKKTKLAKNETRCGEVAGPKEKQAH